MATNTNSQRVNHYFFKLFFLIAIVALVAACGGGGGGDDGAVEDPDQVGAGWITITYPVSGPSYSTGSPTVTLAGEAFISPTWWRCCSGSATDTGVTVTWTNATTGMSGSANQSLTYICLFGSCLPGTHSWRATIDLAFGDNLITVTATDPSGNLGRQRITVVRTTDITPPTVISTIPENGATGVSTNSSVEIKFSELMDPTSLNAFTIVLKDSSNNTISGSVSYAGGVATYTPAASLSGSMLYTAAVTTGAKDVSGNALVAAYLWTFTTGPAPDMAPPSVSSTSPDDGATCVPTETAVSASFSEPISLPTLNTNTFLLKDALNNPVSGIVALDYTGAGYFHPINPLSNATSYTGTLTTDLSDLSGNHLALNYLWTFTTQPAGSGNWNSTSSTGAPSSRTGHTAVWTGTQMIIWGGGYGDGARYDPVTNSWSPVSNVGAPESRTGHVAVWSGTKMIIWGGVRPGAYLNSGAIYDPDTDTWSPMSSLGAPTPRQLSTAVWAGTEMIVWGGTNGTMVFGDGARYNPSTNTWSTLSASGAPSARYGHTAVWSGSAMLVWGGSNLNSGGIYTPSSDSWAAIPLTNAPSARSSHSAVWTGQAMIIWGGYDGNNPLGSGARFNPSSNSWQPIATLCEPLARYGHIGVWNGTEMFVWGGGKANGPHYSAGGRYNPSTNTWQSIPVIGAPGGRMGHTGIWDGNGVIVWGGRDALGTYLDSGGRYLPQ
jgi:N-acetylneuraminic acid mutarotase